MKESQFINREFSWIEFNLRVLSMAKSAGVPLLERLKFLAITASNLDEFFMVRIGALQMLQSQEVTKKDPSGLSPAEQHAEAARRVREMTASQYSCYGADLEPALAGAGIKRIRPEALDEKQRGHAERVFDGEIFPLLTPVAVASDAEPVLLMNRLLYVAVRLKPDEKNPGKQRLAAIAIPRNMNRFISLPSEQGFSFMLIEDLVTLFAQRLFEGESIMECMPFRITRNADLSVREDQAADLMAQMEQVIVDRQRSECVRLEIDERASATLLAMLQKPARTGDLDTYRCAGPLDLSAFMSIANMSGRDELRYEPWPPQPMAAREPGEDMFNEIARGDILLYHPYDAFAPVLRLVEEAADDPGVTAIKQTLYRTSSDSPVIAALMRAAGRGKSVTAVVELKARFDEERNIEWARALEDAGVQVIYGVKRLKTHSKICMIIRREARGLRRYMHFGTGNYNEKTARLYSDVSFMTCNDELGFDAGSFLNAVTGYSQPRAFHKLWAAPIGLRERLLELIESEIERRRQDQEALIMAKLNSLADPSLIDALYSASRAGVTVKLNVRGVCCLRPGIKGMSENISVVSIVDRYLEHARILYFHQGGEPQVFISSADWMPRNLDRRVELLVPVEDNDCRKRLIAILETCMEDTVNAWKLQPAGSYVPAVPADGKPGMRSQETFYRRAAEEAALFQQARRTMLEPHKPPPRDKQKGKK